MGAQEVPLPSHLASDGTDPTRVLWHIRHRIGPGHRVITTYPRISPCAVGHMPHISERDRLTKRGSTSMSRWGRRGRK